MLDLRHNKLRQIPPVVYELSSLQTLYLRSVLLHTLSACYSIVLVIGIWMVERAHTTYNVVLQLALQVPEHCTLPNCMPETLLIYIPT